MKSHATAGRPRPAPLGWLVSLLVFGACGARSQFGATDDDPAAAADAGVGGLAAAATTESSNMLNTNNTGPDGSCGALVTDLEDGTGRICTGNGRLGVWYAFNDTTGTQWPVITAPGDPIETSVIPDGRGNSLRGVHTFGNGFDDWGVGVGLDLAFDGSNYATYDASHYDGITFWARSQHARHALVRISTAETTLVDYGGDCEREPCSPEATAFGPSPEWSQYFVRLPADHRKLTNIQFMPSYGNRPFDLWIDDVHFYQGPPGCATSVPTGCGGALEFANAHIDHDVRTAAEAPAPAELSYGDVCTLYSLVIDDPGFELDDLGGLQCLDRVQELALPAVTTSDLSPLAAMKSLGALTLDSRAGGNLSVLQGLTSLVELHLMAPEFSDLSLLEPLRSLRVLELPGASVTNLEPLRNLFGLVELSLASNPITNLNALEDLLNLERLDLSHVRAAELDLAPLLGLPKLALVDLRYTSFDCADQAEELDVLIGRGVSIWHDPCD